MSSGAHDIVIEQGAAFIRNLVYKDSNGTPVPIAGWTVTMQIRKYKRSTVLFADLDNAGKGGLSISPGSGGAFALRIPADLTALFNFSIACYDILLTPSGANPNPVRLLEGKVSLNKAVTR